MTNRKIFKDKALQEEFERQGYVIITKLFSQEQIDHLTNYYTDLHQNLKESFFTSTYSPDKAYRKKASQLIQSVISNSLQHYLVDYRPVYGNFMVKKSTGKGESELHQDWTFVDEDQFVAINSWSPLTTYQPNSGFIRIVKASDQFPIPYRGRNIDSPLGDIRELIKKNYTTEIEINPGDTVIFNTRSFHCSADNQSGNTRIAVSLILIPKEAQPIHYMMNPEKQNQMDKLNVDIDFFTNFGVWEQPKGLHPVTTQPYYCQKILEKEFIEKFEALTRNDQSN